MGHEMSTVTLNVRYDMPDASWEKLVKVYEAMPGWQGFVEDDCPVWRPDGAGNGHISASVEPSGLLFEADVSKTTWELWLTDFMRRATAALGFEVRDADA